MIREIADAVAKAPQKQTARRGPMSRQIGRLIDHRKADAASGENFARFVAAPAGIEIVAVEIKDHDSGMLHLFEQRVKLGRVEAPAVIELVEDAVSRRGRRDGRIDLGERVRCHQRPKRAERLSGKDDLLIPFLLQPRRTDRPAAWVLSVSVSPRLNRSKRMHVPAVVAQRLADRPGSGISNPRS